MGKIMIFNLLVIDGLVWVFKKLLISWDFCKTFFFVFIQNDAKTEHNW